MPLKRCALYLSVLFLTTAAFASVPEPLTITGQLAHFRGAPRLDLVLTANHDAIREVAVTVTATGGITAEPGNDSVVLAPFVPMRLQVPLTQTSDAPGSVIVRVATSREPLAVSTFYFARSQHRLRQIAAAEYESLFAAELGRRAEATAEAAAAERFAAVIAKGLTPVPVPGEATTAEQRAWNRLAAKHNEGKVRAACGDFQISPYNYTFNVSGNMRYYDALTGLLAWSSGTGYTVNLVTNVEYRDSCGGVQLRTSGWTATTNYGQFNAQNIVSAVNPQTANPFLQISTVLPDVGVRTSGASIATQAQILTSSADMGYSWNGYWANLAPAFTQHNSNWYYFFRWNDEIVKLKNDWKNRGWSFTFWTDFRAGYDSTVPSAHFYQANPNMYWAPNALVVFGTPYQSTTRWIMAHEFGHHFQFRMQHDYLCCGEPHTICGVAMGETAFSEGFADWHASYHETEGRDAFYSCSFGECAPCPYYSYRVQGNVHGFLWDIFDATNSATHDGGYDDVNYTFQAVFNNWRQNKNYVSFSDFFFDMQDKGVWTQPNTDLLRVWNHVTTP